MTRATQELRSAACLTASLLLGGANVAAGDDVAKLELGVGYALLFHPDGHPSRLPVGLAADLSVNPLPSLAVVAEAGASYSEGPDAVGEIAVLGGLRYSLRRRVVLSVEALGGGVHRTEPLGPAGEEAAWHGALQAGTALSFRIAPDALLRASASFRKVLAGGEPSQGFRFLLGATLGLRRSGGPGRSAKALELPGRTLPAPPGPDLSPPSADQPTPRPVEPSPPAPTEPAPDPTSLFSPPAPSIPPSILPLSTLEPPPTRASLPTTTAGFERGRGLLERGLYREVSPPPRGRTRDRTATSR